MGEQQLAVVGQGRPVEEEPKEVVLQGQLGRQAKQERLAVTEKTELVAQEALVAWAALEESAEGAGLVLTRREWQEVQELAQDQEQDQQWEALVKQLEGRVAQAELEVWEVPVAVGPAGRPERWGQAARPAHRDSRHLEVINFTF